MKKRIIVAAIALPLLLIVLLALRTVFTAVLLAAMCGLAAWELLYATGLVRHVRLVVYSILMAVSVSFWSWLNCPRGFAVLFASVYFIALAAELIAANGELPFEQAAISVFAGVVVPGLLSAIVRLLIMDNGRFLVLVPFIIAFSADSGAYFVGRAFGRRKLAPIISPKKTVEGAIGGVICSVLAMLIYSLVLRFGFDFEVNYIFAFLYGALGAAGSIVGDLVFSVIKRQVKLKDYGYILPGHGGILDRFDSMVVVAPLTEALVLLIPFAVKVVF